MLIYFRSVAGGQYAHVTLIGATDRPVVDGEAIHSSGVKAPRLPVFPGNGCTYVFHLLCRRSCSISSIMFSVPVR